MITCVNGFGVKLRLHHLRAIPGYDDREGDCGCSKGSCVLREADSEDWQDHQVRTQHEVLRVTNAVFDAVIGDEPDPTLGGLIALKDAERKAEEGRERRARAAERLGAAPVPAGGAGVPAGDGDGAVPVPADGAEPSPAVPLSADEKLKVNAEIATVLARNSPRQLSRLNEILEKLDELGAFDNPPGEYVAQADGRWDGC